MLTQIYEVSTLGEARSIAMIGVDHVGILVGKGEFPRELSVERAADVAAEVLPPSRVSALFLTADLSAISKCAAALRPPIVHLGAAPELLSPGDGGSAEIHTPGCVIMRSVPVVDEGSIALACDYDGITDFLLLDSHRPFDRQIGALGVTHDWTISRRIVELVRTPVILAGGLGPDNVAEAILAVRPAGVLEDQDGPIRLTPEGPRLGDALL